MFFIAQNVVDDAAAQAERLRNLGFSGLCLFIAILACTFAWWQMRRANASEEDKAKFLSLQLQVALEQSKQREKDARDHERDTNAKYEVIIREKTLSEKEMAVAVGKMTDVVVTNTKVLERINRKQESA